MTDQAMKLSNKALVFAACGVLAATMLAGIAALNAQEAPDFTIADSNVDGLVDEMEFLVAFPTLTSAEFADADTNADTVLTDEEYEAYVLSMAE